MKYLAFFILITALPSGANPVQLVPAPIPVSDVNECLFEWNKKSAEEVMARNLRVDKIFIEQIGFTAGNLNPISWLFSSKFRKISFKVQKGDKLQSFADCSADIRGAKITIQDCSEYADTFLSIGAFETAPSSIFFLTADGAEACSAEDAVVHDDRQTGKMIPQDGTTDHGVRPDKASRQ
jgi:hypothetical protein